MRIGLNLFRLALAVAWLVILWISFQAVSRMGFGVAGGVFIGDFAHPWRAQFNGDFAIHLLLVAAWIIYRSKSSRSRPTAICASCCSAGGPPPPRADRCRRPRSQRWAAAVAAKR
jgi:hypothetical protein